MRPVPLHHLKSVWPFWVSGLVFLVGLAVDGIGGGLIAATLSFLVAGPLYLGRQWWLRRTGRIPPPTPRTPAEQALVIRLGVVASALVAVVFLVDGALRGELLPEGQWTAFSVVAAACGLGAAPYAWATAAEVEHGRASRRAWMLAAASDCLVAVGLLVVAAANLWAGWLSGAWTVALAIVGAMWVVMAFGCVARFRAPDA